MNLSSGFIPLSLLRGVLLLVNQDSRWEDFDLDRRIWRIQVIASSGAGKVEHFSEVFGKTKAEAALAAGIFHREEVPIEAVKEHMREKGIETR